jgi:AcrR family transcriptional regulator
VTVTEAVDQRQRILDVALRLMAEGGVHAMSMRHLAKELDLNVATIYHYFGSKSELRRAVVDQQDYATLLEQEPPIDRSRPPGDRLAALLRWIWSEMGTQDDMWRLLLGESLRGDTEVLHTAADLTLLFERALVRWLEDLVPEVDDPSGTTARVLRGVVYGFFVEHLPLPGRDRDLLLARRADDVADVFLRG